MRPISPGLPIKCSSAEHVNTGVPIPKPLRVSTMSSTEWESFTEEWANSLKDLYIRVARHTGSGDQGIDVAGYLSDMGWEGGWDNYQCKHYDRPLTPSNIWVEIGKIIYYSYKQEYTPPRKYYFIASCGIGTRLEKLLANSAKFKEEARENWTKYCQDKITETASIPLEGDLMDWFEDFDFSIFSTKSVVKLIEGHAKTPFHSVRFGGGLPCRPEPSSPPEEHDVRESRYIQHLFSAYSDSIRTDVRCVSDLSPSLNSDYLRQRERFYHAESLRNFARDTVPDGTFEKLQEEVFHGVIDTCTSSHQDGLARMRATLSQAAHISTVSNPLGSVVKTQDRQGICHQLANEDKLLWIPTSKEVEDEIPI
jgi:hypothetical protein